MDTTRGNSLLVEVTGHSMDKPARQPLSANLRIILALFLITPQYSGYIVDIKDNYFDAPTKASMTIPTRY